MFDIDLFSHHDRQHLQDDVARTFHQSYVLSSQYESLDSDDLYTKYKVCPS
jgi:hypothetical protein